MKDDLTYLDEHGILGNNFYWQNHERYGISKDEIESVGIKDSRVQVHKDLIPALIEIDRAFKEKLGYRLYVREGYRSKDLYRLVYEKRTSLFGKEQTDKLLNIESMPHSTGKSVDVSLWDEKNNSEVLMKNKDDGLESLLVNFYSDKTDENSIRYQYLQDEVKKIMEKFGFSLGTRNEFFHFNYSK